MKKTLYNVYIVFITLMILCRPYLIKVFELLPGSFTLPVVFAVFFSLPILILRNKKAIKIDYKNIIVILLLIVPTLFNNAYIAEKKYGVYLYYIFSILLGTIFVLTKPKNNNIKLMMRVILFFAIASCFVSWISYYSQSIYVNFFAKLLPKYEQSRVISDFVQFKAIPGLADHYSRNAFYIILGLVSCYYLYKDEKINSTKYYTFGAIFILTLLMIGKRGHLIFFIGATILTYLISNKISKKIIKRLLYTSIIVVLGAIISFFLIPATKTTIKRFINTKDISTGRFVLYKRAFDMYHKNGNKPLGFGQFSRATNFYYSGVHNDYIQVFVETGIIGASITILVNIYFLVYSIKRVRKNNSNYLAIITLFYNIFYLTYSFTGIPHYDFETNAIYFLLNALLVYDLNNRLFVNKPSVGIITLNGYYNYGNRLQNYALTKVLEDNNYNVHTIWNKSFKQKVKDFLKCGGFLFKKIYKRHTKFYLFSRFKIKETNTYKSNLNKLDNIVIGSDQVWNPKEIKNDTMLLGIDGLENKTITYAASLGVSSIPSNIKDEFKNSISKFKSISVRETIGEKIIKDITNRDDIKTVLDPTLLLKKEDWENIERKPSSIIKNNYILLYFIGEIDKNIKNEINKYAKNNNYQIIDLSENYNEYYKCGPKEFIYLVHHSKLVFTDSFHASVFSLIFDRPFITYKRSIGELGDMTSRIQTLIDTFKIENRLYNGKNITDENISHNYDKSYKILEEKRKESLNYLLNSLK